MSKSAALHRQWWRLHEWKKISSGTKIIRQIKNQAMGSRSSNFTQLKFEWSKIYFTLPSLNSKKCATCVLLSSLTRRYMAEIMLIRRKTPKNQSINLPLTKRTFLPLSGYETVMLCSKGQRTLKHNCQLEETINYNNCYRNA